MDLQINNNHQAIYELHLNFTGKNTQMIKDHLSILIDTCEEICISLSKVERIDKEALLVMTELYEKAMEQGKILFFEGCKRMKVNTLFIKGKIHFIFKDDNH